jgi:phage N-6-adenine-methyltransferase
MTTDLFGVEHGTRRDMASHQIPPGGNLKSTDEWLTPPTLIDALGPFDLDPCSPGERRPWDTAAKHYSIEDDGLRQPWEGRVWLNPPYSDMRRWLAKLADHDHGTALIFARTETALWFDLVWGRASAVLFLRGRVSFHYVNGKRAKANSGAPSALIAYGERDSHILAEGSVPGHYVELANEQDTP